MSYRMLTKQFDKLERRMADLPCPVCSDYPTQAEVLRGDEPEAPNRVCPACGRIARMIIRLHRFEASRPHPIGTYRLHDGH